MVRDRKAGRPLRSAPEEVNSKERFASGQRRHNCRSSRCPGSQTPSRVSARQTHAPDGWVRGRPLSRPLRRALRLRERPFSCSSNPGVSVSVRGPCVRACVVCADTSGGHC